MSVVSAIVLAAVALCATMTVSLISSAIRAVESTPIPDTATRFGIGVLVGKTRRRLAKAGSVDAKRFACAMHYARTAQQWLSRFDDNYKRIGEILADVYGRDAALWCRRWRLFYMATEGLFGHDQGREWGVSHYLLRPAW